MKRIIKRPAKDQRERLVLLGLVELYLQFGKPVGSNTLRENGFEDLSSATIRNYFMRLEESGYLKQQHSSGGRIPTHQAYKYYAGSHLESPSLTDKEKQVLRSQLIKETREVATYLQQAAETISEETRCAVFLSAPRFDQDFVLDIKLVPIDPSRCLCILITDFGLIHTETLYADKNLSTVNLKHIEAYLHWRSTGQDKKPKITVEEEELGQKFYNEVMLRHIVNYTHFTAEDIYKTGFSKLLGYPDFNEASALANGLSLFENPHVLRSLLKECGKTDGLRCWIGDDLHEVAPNASACSIIAVPYRINQTIAGSLAILGPNRIPYRQLFGILHAASSCITESLTKSLYKFKISFREPQVNSVGFKYEHPAFLLEDKT